MLLMHREDKMLECEAEKGLLQGQVRRWVTHAQKPWALWWFWRESFYRLRERAAVYVLSSQWGVRMVLQESCAQPEVAILHLGGGLSSHRRTQRYHYMHSLKRNQDPATRLHYHFLTAPPLLPHLLLSLISNYLNLPFGTQVRLWRLNEAYLLQARNGGHRKDLNQGQPHRFLLGVTMNMPSPHLCF